MKTKKTRELPINQIFKGDCIKEMKKMKKNSIDMIFVDPPYNLNKQYSNYDDKLKDKEYIKWCNKWLSGCMKLLKPTGSLFVINIPKWLIYHAYHLNKIGVFRHWIAWDALGAPTNTKLLPSHYGILWYTKTSDSKTYTVRIPHERDRKGGLLADWGGKKVDVAVDFTDWFYYGKDRSMMILGKKPEKGTTKCFRFATINVVERGERFTLLALPVSTFDTKEKVLENLISFAKKRISIRKLYVDRGFFSANVINLLKKMGITFLMPAIMNDRVIDYANSVSPPTVIKNYPMKDCKFNLIVIEKEETSVQDFFPVRSTHIEKGYEGFDP